jgi:Holliday junction resolvase-like predicted endonuclease
LTKSERWILSEWLVATDRTLNHGERLLKHRERTPFAEIDLLTLSGCNRLLLIEVKTVKMEIWGERSLITRAQANRLLRARAWLEDSYQKPVSLSLAVVSHDLQVSAPPNIQYFEAGFDWLLT